jgi:hypothetical protein
MLNPLIDNSIIIILYTEYTDQVNPGERYDPLLMSPVKSTSTVVDEGEDTRFKEGLSLDTIETWIVYVCHSEGGWARQKI